MLCYCTCVYLYVLNLPKMHESLFAFERTKHYSLCVCIIKSCNLFSLNVLCQIISVIFFFSYSYKTFFFFSHPKKSTGPASLIFRTGGLRLLTSFLVGYWWHIFGSKGLWFSDCAVLTIALLNWNMNAVFCWPVPASLWILICMKFCILIKSG